MSFLDDARTRELWEKVKAELSGKQPKLRGSAGQVVGFNTQGAAVAVSGWSNPNLLENWYFQDPVNQRGQEEYAGAGYTLDRWISTQKDSQVKIVDSGIEIKRTTETRIIFSQRITTDRSVFDQAFAGRTVTISALFGEEFRYATMKIPTSNSVDWYPGGTADKKVNDMYIRLSIYSNSDIGRFEFSFDIYVSAGQTGGGLVTAVKCEYGSQQTLARQDAAGNWVLNDPPPDKALELLKCQRYQVAVYARQTYSMFGFAYGYSESVAVAFVPVPCNFRSAPTAIFSGDFSLVSSSGGGDTKASSIRIDQYSTNGVRLRVETESPITIGTTYQFRAKGDPTAYILFDNNL